MNAQSISTKRRPFRVVLVALLLGGLMVTSGGCLYRDIRGPGPINYITQFKLTTADFEILGPVEASGTVKNYLFLVMTGGNGYEALLKKAKAMGGHGLINYTFTLEHYSILTLIYNSGTWHAHAMAIRYKNVPPSGKPATTTKPTKPAQ